MKALKLIVFFLLSINTLSSQVILEGIVKDKATQELLSFATVQYGPSQGVITNEQGYFRISTRTKIQQITISYIGYQSQEFTIAKADDFVEVLMSQTVIPLETITVYSGDTRANDLFYKSINRSKKDANYRQTAKTFRRTYSYRDMEPCEHMEAFYNAKTRGGGVDFIDLKNGRYGVPSDTSFINMQMTTILRGHKLFTREYTKLPVSPLEYSSAKKLKEDYHVRISNIFAVERDTILEFTFYPIVDEREKFRGKAWVRNSNLMIEKVNLEIKNTTVNPFIILPYPEYSKVTALDFNLTFGFKYHEKKAVFDYLNFTYNMDVTTPVDTFNILSNTNLYFYDYNSAFTIPFFPETAIEFHDYEQILFFPYNKKFWEINYLIAETEEEKSFREELESRQLFKNQGGTQAELIQRRFEPWDPKWQIEPQLVAGRELWENQVLDEITYVNRVGIPYEYTIFAKTFIFLDYDCYPNDTIFFKTEAILDYRFSFSVEREVKDFEYLEDFLRIAKIHACKLQLELNEEFGAQNRCPERRILQFRLNQAMRKLKKDIADYNNRIHALGQDKKLALSQKVKLELDQALEKVRNL